MDGINSTGPLKEAPLRTGGAQEVVREGANHSSPPLVESLTASSASIIQENFLLVKSGGVSLIHPLQR